MQRAPRLQSALNVRPEEARTTGLMWAHSFFMGLATVFFETAAAALFLERFGPSVLPFVYVAAAVLNSLTGAVFSAVQQIVAFRMLMGGTLAVLLATTIGLRLGLVWFGTAGALVFALFVWYRAVSALTDLEYWAVAGRLFDVRQAKRLFGLIGSGEVVARIAGSFAVPLLVGGLGVPNLLVWSAVAMAACLGLVRAVLAGGDEAGAARAADATDRAPAPRVLWRDQYLVLIFALSFAGVLAKYFVDFAFLAEMRARFGDAKGLASFFAIFSGVSQTLSLLTRVFVSGRLLDRFGLRVGLLVLPAAQVGCTALIVAAGLLSAGPALVFWLVMANQGLYKTLKHPVDNPSFKILYQPLSKERRLAAQIAVETVITPAAIGLAGIVMLFFTRALTYRPATFALVLVADFAAWLALAAAAGRAYAGALKAALKGRLDDEDQIFLLLNDAASVRALRQTLRSPRADDVLPALALLDKAGDRRLDEAVLDLLAHPAVDVRRAALAHVERHRPPGAVDAVERRLAVEPSARVRAAGVRCLCALAGPDAAGRLRPLLDDDREDLRRAALVGLLVAGLPEAEGRLAALARAAPASSRLEAAHVLGEAAQARYHALLLPLLEDAEAAVRRAALAAAGRMRAPELWAAVARGLAERPFAGAAAAALGQGGAAAVDDLDAAFWGTRSAALRTMIVRVLGRIGGPAATAQLEQRLGFPDARVRYEALLALRAVGFRAEGESAGRCEAALAREADDALWKTTVSRDLGDVPETGLVREALERERRAGGERVLLLLSFLLDPRAIRRAADNLRHESRDRRAYALEMLDVTLPGPWRGRLLPLFEELAPAERLARMNGGAPPAVATPIERLEEMLRQPPGRLAPWTSAVVLQAAERLGASRPAEDRVPQEVKEAMLTIEKVIVLRSVHMFAESSDEILSDVASIVEEVELGAAEVVFEKGDTGDSMYVIVEGAVRVYDGERVISRLGARDIFGELALLDPEPRLASVAAVVPTRLLRLDREAFLELMQANIEIVRGVLHVLCERLRRASTGGAAYHDAPVPPPAA